MNRDSLDRLRVASPCPASWDEMAGDARVRHCTLCDLNVYNFAEMTREEVQALLQRSEGRVCARLFRRADGTVLTRDCPTGLRALRMRASRAAAAILAAALSMAGIGCSTRKLVADGSKVKVTTERARVRQPAVLAGVVMCEERPLSGAIVRVVDETSKLEKAVVTDSGGAFSVDVGDGSHEIHVTLDDHVPATIEHLALSSRELAGAEIALLSEATIGVIVTAAEPVRISEPLTTTFSQDFVEKMPR
jgi:hypothetical protein